MTILNDYANNNTKSYRKTIRTLRKINKLTNEYYQITNDSSVFINSFVGEYFTSVIFRDLNMMDSAYVHALNAYYLFNPYGNMVCSSDTSSFWSVKLLGNDGIFGILRDWNVKQNNMQEAIRYCSIITDSCRAAGANSEMLQSLIKTGEIYEKFDDYENSIICQNHAIDDKLKMGITNGNTSVLQLVNTLLNTYNKWHKWVNKYYATELQRKALENNFLSNKPIINNILSSLFSGEDVGFLNDNDVLLFANTLVEMADMTQDYEGVFKMENTLDGIYELLCGKESIAYAKWQIKKHDICEKYVSSKAQFKNKYKRKSTIYLENAFSIWDNYLTQNSIDLILKECKKRRNKSNNELQDSLDILDNYYLYLSKLGKNKFDMGLYSDALKIIKQRIKVSELFDLEDKTNNLCFMGDIYLHSNEYNKAEKWYQKALKHAENSNDTIEMAKVHLSLWALYMKPNFYKKDPQLADKAINNAYNMISKTNCRSIEKCNVLNSLAKFYNYNYNNELALDLNWQAIFELIGLNQPVPEILYVENALYQSRLFGKIPDYSLEKLASISLNDDSTFVTQKASELLGSYYGAFTSDLEKSVNYYSKAYDIAKILNDTISQFNYLADIGILYYIQNDYEKALKYMLDAENVYPQKAIVSELISLMTHIDNKELVENRISRKFQIVRNQIKDRILLLTSKGREFLIQNERVNFLQFRSMPYYYSNSKICTEISYNSLLLYKGLLLNTQKDITDVIEKTKDGKIRNLYQKIQDINANNHVMIDNDDDTSLDGTSIKNNMEIENLERELISELTKKELVTFSDVAWQQVQKHLKKNEVAVEFTEINNLDPLNLSSIGYGALILRNDYDAPKFIVLDSKEEIDGNIETFLSLLNKGTRMNNDRWSNFSERLYKSIWGKLEEFVDKGDVIYFTLDGLLNKAPIEVLSDSNGVMVNEKYNLFRLSSTRELCKQRKEDISKVVLYGGLLYDAKPNGQKVDSIEAFQYLGNDSIRSGWDYLPASSTEVDSISYLLSSQGIKTIKKKGLSGTEESFKKLSGSDISTIHIATHGFYFPQQEAHYIDYFNKNESNDYISPMKRSGLMMTGGQSAWLGTKIIEKERDGILTAEEIATLDLSNVNMVVLSACQTGLGDIDPGAEGVLGIQRAFKMAGVQSLLMSLWKVDDNATAYMMQEFYSGLLSGETKHDAFKTAQQKVRNKYPNPFYWAGFVLLD